MKIFLTGATGFVGAHSARELLRAGHELRLLVRDPKPARDYLARHGFVVDDFVVADMRDRDTVRRGMAGCDAVLHAAAAVSLDPRKAQQTYENNVGGMEAVIGTACELGIERIVYVSSLSVLFRPGASALTEASPLGTPRDAYARSKRDADLRVRELQAEGHPIAITYPSAIIGPEDPRLSEANFAIQSFLTQMLPRTSTGIQFVDVRDVALAHHLLLEREAVPQPEDARYILIGPYFAWAALHEALERVTGRRVFAPRVPGALLRATGVAADLARRVVPFGGSLNTESMSIVTRWPAASADKACRDLGIAFRDSDNTFSDTIRWLAEAGHLPARRAGDLLATTSHARETQ